MTIFGALFFIAAATRTRTVATPVYTTQPLWMSILLVTATGVGGGLIFLAGRRLRRRGRRHSVPVLKTMDQAKAQPYVLYLRPFVSDLVGASMAHAFSRWSRVGGSLVDGSTVTVEERISRGFRKLGRLVAVGQPEESLPQPGAARLYLPLENWQPVVTSLIRDARVVLLATGTSEGTLWELGECLRKRTPEGLLLLVYSSQAAEYDAFRERAEQIFAEHADVLRGTQGPAWRPPRFPEYPALQKPDRAKWLPVPSGYIRFDAQWTPHLVRLDPTQVRGWTQEGRHRRMNREQLRPLLDAFLNALADVEMAESRAEMRQCVTVAEVEEIVRTTRTAAMADTPMVNIKISSTARIHAVELSDTSSTPTGDPEPDGPAAMAERRGEHEMVQIKISLAMLDTVLRQVRNKGAQDADTMYLELSPRSRVRGFSYESPESTDALP